MKKLRWNGITTGITSIKYPWSFTAPALWQCCQTQATVFRTQLTWSLRSLIIASLEETSSFDAWSCCLKPFWLESSVSFKLLRNSFSVSIRCKDAVASAWKQRGWCINTGTVNLCALSLTNFFSAPCLFRSESLACALASSIARSEQLAIASASETRCSALPSAALRRVSKYCLWLSSWLAKRWLYSARWFPL